MHGTHTSGAVGVLLREWRGARRYSQLDLALEAEVSARHLSYVESGKSQPSRDLLERLAEALHMPLGERNALFLAGGFAPEFAETALSAPHMAPIQRAVELTLKHHEPYPAFVVNRHWDVTAANGALGRVFARLRPGGPRHANIVRQIFDPDDMRPLIANWEEVASDLVRHLHAETIAAPSDVKLRALLKEALSYPGVPQTWRTRELGVRPLPVLTAQFRAGDLELSFFSTIARFGGSRDVTIEDLRIECMFPSDDATAAFCAALV